MLYYIKFNFFLLRKLTPVVGKSVHMQSWVCLPLFIKLNVIRYREGKRYTKTADKWNTKFQSSTDYCQHILLCAVILCAAQSLQASLISLTFFFLNVNHIMLFSMDIMCKILWHNSNITLQVEDANHNNWASVNTLTETTFYMYMIGSDWF